MAKVYGAAAASRRTKMRWLKKARARRKYLSTCRRRLGVAKARTLAPVRLSAPLIPESHRLPAPAPVGAGPFGLGGLGAFGTNPYRRYQSPAASARDRAVFRKWKTGDQGVIALFPDLPWNRQGQVTSYEHIGQHGAADYPGVVRQTVPASRAEAASLRRELRGRGYRLNNPGGYLTSLSESQRPSEAGLMSQIRSGDKVTFADHFGQLRTGRAVMPSAHGGWVLNMGGAHGTPAVVDERNVVRVKKAREVARNPELLVVNNPCRNGGSFHDVARRHQLKIALQTLKMDPAMAAVMGGPSIEEAREIVRSARAKGELVRKRKSSRNPRRRANMRTRRRRRSRNAWKGNRRGHRRAAIKGWRKRRHGGKRRKYSKRRKGSRKGRRRVGGRVFKGAIKYHGKFYRRKALKNKIGKRRLKALLKKRGRKN